MIESKLQQFDLLLEGKVTAPLGGKYFDAINPSNGEVFARLADADGMDIEIAISAARLAFDHGRWPRMPIAERGKYFLNIAELIRENAKELADLECWATGKTIKHATFLYASHDKLTRETIKKFAVLNACPLLRFILKQPHEVVGGWDTFHIAWPYTAANECSW